MKKMIYMSILALIAAGSIFWSCQKDETLTNPEEGLMLKSGTDCDCVDEPIIKKFVTTSSNQGNFADVEIWNDNQKLFIKVTANDENTMDRIQLSYPFVYSVTNARNCIFDINYNIDFNNGDVAFNTHTFELELPENWNGCDQVGFALIVKGNGNPVYLQGDDVTEDFSYKQGSVTCTNVPSPVVYTLMEVCDIECEESFSYVKNTDGTYTFTYKPTENLNDVLVEFTFAQSDRVIITGDVESWDEKGQTRQKVMSFKKCTPVSWTVGLEPKCSGHSGKSNLWTDFKVGDISKKNITKPTPNITTNCPL